MAIQTISILGCGWLGLALGEHLQKGGYVVKGSTTTCAKLATIEEAGIIPYQLQLGLEGLQGEHDEDFLDTDLLITTIPPQRNNPEALQEYPQKFQELAVELSEHSNSKMIFIGSTSVYGNLNTEVDERDAGDGELRASGEALLETEDLLRENLEERLTILRLAGLIGGERHPGRFLSSDKTYTGGSRPVNLVHREDCIKAIEAVIEQNAWNQVFNVVADEHPSRQAFYEYAARQKGLTPPRFEEEEEESAYKIVSNRKIKEELGLSFTYPSPFDFLVNETV